MSTAFSQPTKPQPTPPSSDRAKFMETGPEAPSMKGDESTVTQPTAPGNDRGMFRKPPMACPAKADPFAFGKGSM